MSPDSDWRSHGPLLETTSDVPNGYPALSGRPLDSMLPIHSKRAIAENSHRSSESDDYLSQIRSGQLWIVNSRRKNGLLIHKRFYTEFAGPGAAVGGQFDEDCLAVIPLGNLQLLPSESLEDQQKALRIRLQWVRLTQNFTDKAVPLERARMILEQFKSYFDQKIVEQVPDEAFALLVGVLPTTIRRARRLV